MLENSFGHTWCDCFECDQTIEAFRFLMVRRENRDDDLMIAFIHLSHNIVDNPDKMDTTYRIFGEIYYLLHPHGEIQDPQLVKPDEDDDDD
ncbi:hypothetical protein LCGC14_2091140 [marine sediment metagenome]|uniref:Uncharacterized protein n=1 Tax=marine sediment metagenome TaxID=412755 RepID=A0A0F9ECZ3_9ZZZZ